jgi:hypothetical protein
MKRILLFGFLLILIKSQAQSSDKLYLSNRYSLERMGSLSTNTNSVPGLPAPNPEVIGDRFSKTHFALTNAVLYNEQTITALPAKYDLLHDEFYFQTKQGLRVIAGRQIKSFSFSDSLTQKISYYINAKEFKTNTGSLHAGFFEILFDGSMALLKKQTATVQQANYHVALNVGRLDHQISKKTEYYYLKDDVAMPLPKKSVTTIFGDKKVAIDKYIKINQLNTKDERHLILIFEAAQSIQ